MTPIQGPLYRTLFLSAIATLAITGAAAAQTPGNAPPDLADELLRQLDDVDPAAPGELAGAISPRRQWTLSAILAAATLASEDLTCLAGGLLVARRKLPFLSASAACFAGIFLGDLLLVLVGRWLGRGALKRWPFRRIVSREALARSEAYFRERGPRVVFLSRFVPGSRLPLFLAAGILRAPVPPIAGALAVAGILWTPLLVGLSAWTGGAALRLFARYERLALPVLLLAALLTWLMMKWILPLLSWRGRRFLLSRWHRITKWEFWPAWVFEFPVLLQVVRLGWRHGGIGTFAAANPGIPAGGFVEESKSAILDALRGAPVASFIKVELSGPVAGRSESAIAAMAAAGLGFPAVVKPDVGERGRGVSVVRSAAELAQKLADESGTWLVQEYVAGEEFGLFYARRPGEESGWIFSITAKRFPVVVGDGRRCLGDLILADDRAVCMALFYFEVNASRIETVPAAGARIQLVEIGNHCRGAVFFDGGEHLTPELEREIDRIAKSSPGFFFGRFDLRAPSAADLRAGRNLRILELNGVTSEATHIYQPGSSLVEGWRTIFAQWRLAFEIGAANIDRGAKRTSSRELLRLLLARRRRLAMISSPARDERTG